MHYYQFNIGDYAKSTRHLTNAEDLAYRRLIDMYYDKEKPLPLDAKKLSRLINMRENVSEIENILEDFFKKTDDGYVQERIESDIAEYRAKQETARVNGKKGGRPKLTSKNPKKPTLVNLANQQESGLKANQEPLTINQEPLTKNIVKSTNVDCRLSVAHIVNDIFEYWISAMGKDTSLTKLTDKRRKAISDRLKDGFTVDQIKQAIDGCAKDPFSMGQNDRCKPFNDIELICRTGEKLQFFAESKARQLTTAERSAQSNWLTPESLEDF